MESEYSKTLVNSILTQIAESISKIQDRTEGIHTSFDFLASPEGMEKLDAVCMQLIIIGESIKNLDKITSHTLFQQYPSVPWKQVMGMRDIIAHHYFDIDADEIVYILQNELRPLRDGIDFLIKQTQ